MPGAPFPRPSPRRVLAVVALTLAAVGGAVGPWVATAGAHADVAGTVPTAGAVLEQPPATVRLSFTEGVDVGLGGMTLHDGAGRRVPTGTLRQPTPERLVLPVRGDLADGTYIVTWSAVTEDTHSIRGTWTFRVGTATAPAAGAADLADRLLDAERPARAVAVLWGVVRWIGFGALALAVGGAVFAAVVDPGTRDRRRARRLVVGALATLLGAGVVGLAAFGAYSRGGGPADLVDPAVWWVTVGTRFGVVGIARTVLVLGALAVVPVLFRSGPASGRTLPRWWPPLAGVVGLGLVLAPALTGHAASGDDPVLGVAIDVVHVAATAVWLGGLVVLWSVVLAPGAVGDDGRDRDRDLRVARPGEPGAVVTRFSRLAWWCVAGVVTSGFLAAGRLLGGPGDLRASEFGRVLVVKLVVVALLLAAAVGSRERLRRNDPTAAGRRPAGAGRRALRRSVLVEVVLAAVVLAVTARLVEVPPPASAVAAVRPGSAGTVLEDRRVRVDLSVVPGRVGADDVHVYTSRGGTPLAVAAVELTLTPPTDAGAPIPVPLRTLGPGHAFSPGVPLPSAGRWRVTVTVVPAADRPERVVLHGSVRIERP